MKDTNSGSTSSTAIQLNFADRASDGGFVLLNLSYARKTFEATLESVGIIPIDPSDLKGLCGRVISDRDLINVIQLLIEDGTVIRLKPFDKSGKMGQIANHESVIQELIGASTVEMACKPRKGQVCGNCHASYTKRSSIRTARSLVIGCKACCADLKDTVKTVDFSSNQHIAERIVKELEESSGVELLADAGTIHFYSPDSGVWTSIDSLGFHPKVAMYDGAFVLNSDSEHLKVSKKFSEDAFKCAYADVMDKNAINLVRARGAGVAFSNGFVSVDDNGNITLRPHNPENYATHKFNIAWDPTAPADLPRKWISKIFSDHDDLDELLEMIYGYIGACMMGQATKMFKCCLIFTGVGKNSKSVVLDIFKAMFPATAVCATSPSEWNDDTKLADIHGMLINIKHELAPLEFTHPRSKEVLASNPFKIRKIYGFPFELCPTPGLVAGANEDFIFNDVSYGMQRRLRCAAANLWFPLPGEAQISEEVIYAECATQHAGLARECIEAFARAVANGCILIDPPSSVAEKERMFGNGNDLMAAISTCIEPTDCFTDLRGSDVYPAITHAVRILGGYKKYSLRSVQSALRSAMLSGMVTSGPLKGSRRLRGILRHREDWVNAPKYSHEEKLEFFATGEPDWISGMGDRL